MSVSFATFISETLMWCGFRFRGTSPPAPPYCKGGLQERDDPKVQLAREGAPSKLAAKAPTTKPLMQLPPTRAAAVMVLLNHIPSV